MNKSYTEEFKIEAVKQVTERGFTVTDVSNRLGLNRKTLSIWVKRYGLDNSISQYSNNEQELSRLRSELKRVTEERDILKEAAVYFAKESE